ncbi:pentapeptide repeat-containing protein [Rhodococcus erythropolis]|uniref:pentapeptide repeat-containing protein n=1 Tax=Rhodococcus erythropolis TaxID=1833 RepID=UPI00294A281B|nr:pentapeptide repeat-containing protein [Rhodococcus erythropolis]MDV6278268.1 pentapeptide repeat-containing protein [Rhodococcus erythropolis]
MTQDWASTCSANEHSSATDTLRVDHEKVRRNQTSETDNQSLLAHSERLRARHRTAPGVGANLTEVTLDHGHADEANLAGADLTGSNGGDVTMVNTNLSGTIWYDGHTCATQGSIGRCG